MRRVLGEILSEGHGLLYHSLVQLRGIEQMESVVSPDGKPQVSDVKARLLTGDSDDITILDGLTQERGIGHIRLGDIAELLAADALFHLSYLADELGMKAQSLVRLRMLAHIVDFYHLQGRERRVRLLNLGNDAST